MCTKFRTAPIHFNLSKESSTVNLICNKTIFWDQNQHVNNLRRIVNDNLYEYDSSDIHTLKFGCGKFLLLDLLKEKKHPHIYLINLAIKGKY